MKKRIVTIVTAIAMVFTMGTATAATCSAKSVPVVTKVGGTKLTYNKKGLISKEKDSYATTYYKYDKKNRLVKKEMHRKVVKGVWQTVKIKYKKGRVHKVIAKGGNTSTTYTKTFKYNKKGKISKVIAKTPNYNWTGVYKYKGKRLKSIKYTECPTDYIKYNKRGDITKIGKAEIKYTYKGKKIAKIKQKTNWGENITFKLKHKNVKVSKKMYKKVKAQQRSLKFDMIGIGEEMGVIYNY